MLIDSHHHFWRYTQKEYGWISDDMKAIRKDFLPEDLLQELQKNNVDGVVTVQARQTLEETEWLLSTASKHSFIKGVVGWVDLQSPEVEKQLERYAVHEKLVGVRHVVQGEPDDRFMMRKDFLQGISLLEKYGLAYDILIFPKHLPVAAEMVRQFPHQRFVIDHLAKPFIKYGELDPWTSDIKKIASYPNVYCKISGMVTEADWSNWEPALFYPYMEVVYQAFGEDRVMLGTDWPVCLVGGSYSDILEIPTQYFEKLPSAAFNKLVGQNCYDFYGL